MLSLSSLVMCDSCFGSRIAITVKSRDLEHSACNPAGLLQESLGPFGPEMSPECPRVSECPRKWGVSEGVSDGVSPGPFGPRSVQKVSRECPRSVKKVSRTHRGHSGDTLKNFGHSGARGPKGPGGHPVGHSLGHPPFSGTL